VEAIVPVEAGSYRLTLGTCQFGNGAGNVLSATNTELASFNQNTGVCYDANPAQNIVSMIFTVDMDQTIAIECGQYTPYMKLEQLDASKYYINFANETDGVEGAVPAEMTATVGEEFTLPLNKTMYKAGYTLVGWTDGNNTYAPGESFIPASHMVLTAVFEANFASITDAAEEVTVRWYFGTQNGAPDMHLEGANTGNGYLIAQAVIGGSPIDVRLDIDATAGKFKNTGVSDARWAQVNNNTLFTFPSNEKVSVKVLTMNDPATSTLDGMTYYGYENNIATYGTTETSGTSVFTAHDGSWYQYLEVTYPAPEPENQSIEAKEDPQHQNEVYYSTFYDSQVQYELPVGVEAYVADLSGTSLHLTKIAEAGQTIPADNAVILKATLQNFTLIVSEEEPVTFSAANDLQGSDYAIKTPANCYVLSGKDGVVGFYHYTATHLNPHKAYVVYSGQNNAPRHMPFIFDVATGIDNASAKFGGSEKILENGVLYIIKNGVRYNAQGQMVK
jgi:hypothetical protein